jgi:phosphonate transport system substrate-binding protein
MKKLIITLAAGLLLLVFNACVQKEETKNVSLNKKIDLKSAESSPERKQLKIAIGAMITPQKGFAYYKQLMEFIELKIGIHVKLIDKESYAEINSLLREGRLDAAFVCSGPYVDGQNEYGLELLVVPQVNGEKVYYSYIIVPADSPVKEFKELSGKKFAFTDPLSNTGKLVPTYLLAKMGETPDSFFNTYMFTYAHDKAIRAVAMKLVDGAAVDSLIWEYTKVTSPEITSKTKVILKSQPYGIPPFVVRPGLTPGIKARLKEILLGIHEDKRGREILEGMLIERFVEADNSLYDSVREIKVWIADQKG